jgi:hypothetical protein
MLLDFNHLTSFPIAPSEYKEDQYSYECQRSQASNNSASDGACVVWFGIGRQFV